MANIMNIGLGLSINKSASFKIEGIKSSESQSVVHNFAAYILTPSLHFQL